MRSGGREQQLVPRQADSSADLPLLPLFDHVLLPGGFLRVSVPAGWHKSSGLVELLLQQQAGEVLVAAVPYLTSTAGGKAGGALGGEEEGVGEEQLDLDRLHHTGTAARVLQLVRRTQSGGWTITLEGRCRVRVRSVHLARRRPPQELYEATVEQLDYFAAAPGGASGRGSGNLAGLIGAGSSASGSVSREQEELSQELLKGTRRLFQLVQGDGRGREAAARVARALAQQGPARMSDVLGSLVARALQDRLSLLSTLDVTARLQLVVELLSRMLEVAEKAAAGGGGAAAGRSLGGAARRGRRSIGSGRPLRLSDFGVGDGGSGGGGAGDPEEDDGDEEEDEAAGKRELAALMRKLEAANPPAEVMRAARREFRRLQRGSDQHPGYAMSLAYLETLADLPWHKRSQPQQQAQQGMAADPMALTGASSAASSASLAAPAGFELPLGVVRQRLDEAHYGLDKIKERIVQYVAVQRLRGWDARAPILCFIGPPGVGKTSLARSIAEVLGRPFQRISLGGVRDEAEVRGHRRTYIGAMPGRIIQAVRKAGACDPLLLLDEVDKMGRDARGDPSAALLEVLDPEQNTSFVDTYLGLPWDLSPALFVATANRGADIPGPLLDRLEVVQLGGYTLAEKVHIAERHLLPRLLSEHGLHQGQLVFPPDSVRSIIEGYTGEAGVRSLSRCLAAVCRHVAVQVVQQREQEQERDQPAPGGSGGADTEAGPLGGIIGGGGGSGSGRGGGGEQPEQLPLDEAAARAMGAAAAAALGVDGRRQAAVVPTPAGLRSIRTFGGGSSGAGGLQLQQQSAPDTGRAALRLWAQLVPLAALWAGDGGGSAAAVVSATGGYPWPHLPEPAPRRRRAGSRGGPAPAAGAPGTGASSECSCSPRRQQGWFSWLHWPWRDSSAEHQAQHGAQHAQHDAPLAAAGSCSCAGNCSEPDCCCLTHSRGHAPTAWAASGAGNPQLPAGDSSSSSSSSMWESSWAQSAAAAAGGSAASGPLLCGPGSMQVLRPVPPSTQRFAAHSGPISSAATGVAAGPSPLHQEHQAVLPPELGGSDPSNPAGPFPDPHQPWPQHAQQQQEQQQQHQGLAQHAQVVVDELLIEAVLGPPRFQGHSSAERVASPGTAAGLVWTAVGGKVQYIECICVGEGRAGSAGHLTLTGQLGDVLEESARIALSWVRAHAGALGLPADASCPSRKWDVHIHLPAGAVPKDGPSAGITLAVALVSLFTGRCVRADTAMTGELTLRGLVLPVGGVKEKMLAAQAAGMARVLVPARNLPDVQADVAPEVREALQVVPCQRLEEVLEAAFDPPIHLQAQPLLARL